MLETKNIFSLIMIQVILFVIGGIIAFKRPENHKYQRMLPRPIKAIISFTMLLSAFIVFKNAPKIYCDYSLFVFIGMAFSSLGDLIMCQLIRTPNNLVGGMIAFSMGHLSYAMAYVKILKNNNDEIMFFIILAFVIFISLITLGCKALKKKMDKISVVEVGAVIYGCIIINMFIFATLLSIKVGGNYKITLLAAIVFMISDAIIAITDIGGKHSKFEGLAVWVTYISAQMGIICAVLI